MINLKDNLISKRAHAIIEKKEFMKEHLQASFEVNVDSSDKILTVFYGKALEGLELLFADVLSRFSKNRKISELWALNFREAESFLRDENHEAAFSSGDELAVKSFQKMKFLLIATLAQELLQGELLSLKEQALHWQELTLVEKNLWAQKLLSPFKWRLILCEKDLLTITDVPKDLVGEDKSEDLSFLFSGILEGGQKDLPVKVVAV